MKLVYNVSNLYHSNACLIGHAWLEFRRDEMFYIEHNKFRAQLDISCRVNILGVLLIEN